MARRESISVRESLQHLNQACIEGNLAEVERILANEGASFTSTKSNSPLHIAAKHGHRGICIRLVAVHRLSPSARDESRMNAFDVAIASGFHDMGPLLIQLPVEMYAAGMSLQNGSSMFLFDRFRRQGHTSFSMSPPRSEILDQRPYARLVTRHRAVSSPEKPLFTVTPSKDTAKAPPLAAERQVISRAIRRLNIFDSYSEDAMTGITKQFERRKANSGEHLIKQGENPEYLYILIMGSATATHHNTQTDTRSATTSTICKMGPGSVIGDLPLLLSCPSSCTIAVTTDSIVCCLAAREFQKVAKVAVQAMISQSTQSFTSLSSAGSDPDPSDHDRSVSPDTRQKKPHRWRSFKKGFMKRVRKVTKPSNSSKSPSSSASRGMFSRGRSATTSKTDVATALQVSYREGKDCVFKVSVNSDRLVVVAATESRLFEFLLDTSTDDVFFASDFFLTYRYFTKPETFVQSLDAVISVISSDLRQVDAVARLLCKWTQQKPFPSDPMLKNDSETIKSIRDLYTKLRHHGNSPFFAPLAKHLKVLSIQLDATPSKPDEGDEEHQLTVFVTRTNQIPDVQSFEISSHTTLEDIVSQICKNTADKHQKRSSITSLSEEEDDTKAVAFMDEGAYLFRLYGMWNRINPETDIFATGLRVVTMVPRREYELDQDVAESLYPEFIADHLTMLDFETFCKIQPNELLEQRWRRKPEEAPHVNEIIDRFNKVCQWIIRTILCEITPKKRAAVIEQFVDLAHHFHVRQNFHGVTQVYAALKSQSISRLKDTWQEVEHSSIMALQTLSNKIINPDNNRQSYRQCLADLARITEPEPFDQISTARLQHPTLPYLGLFLSDLVFTEDGNPSKMISRLEALNEKGNSEEDDDEEADFVNFYRYRSLARIISELRTYQATPYTLTELPKAEKQNIEFTRWFFKTFEGYSDQDAWTRSRDIEKHGSQPSQPPKETLQAADLMNDRFQWRNINDGVQDVAALVDQFLMHKSATGNMTSLMANTTPGPVQPSSTIPLIHFISTVRHSGSPNQPYRILAAHQDEGTAVTVVAKEEHLIFTDFATKNVMLRPRCNQIDTFRYDPHHSLLYLTTETPSGNFCHVFRAEGLSGDDAFLVIYRQLRQWAKNAYANSEEQREKAMNILKDISVTDGAFVLRDSQSREGCYALTLKHDGMITHFLIFKGGPSDYYLKDSELHFVSLRDLLMYHCVHSDGLPCTLNPEGSSYMLKEDFEGLASNAIIDASNCPKPRRLRGDQPKTLPFYYGPISRQEAEDVLHEDPFVPGSYLIRDSARHADSYVLSIAIDKSENIHILIECQVTPNGEIRYCLENLACASSLERLLSLCKSDADISFPFTLTQPKNHTDGGFDSKRESLTTTEEFLPASVPIESDSRSKSSQASITSISSNYPQQGYYKLSHVLSAVSEAQEDSYYDHNDVSEV